MLFTSRVWKADATAGATLKALGWEDTTMAARRVPESGYWAAKDQPDSLANWIGAFAAGAIAGGKK